MHSADWPHIVDLRAQNLFIKDRFKMSSSTSKVPIHLIPSPGAADEFMATIQPLIASNHSESDRRKVETAWNTMLDEIRATTSDSNIKIVLEGYTRDGWAWKPNADQWVTMTVVNHHENRQKKKLENFVKYLKERQKSAYGRFGTLGLFVVSYVQSSHNNNGAAVDQIDCRISTNMTLIPNCTIVPLLPQSHDRSTLSVTSHYDRKDGNEKTVTTKNLAAVVVPKQEPTKGKLLREKGGGFLGKLVGAQQRTNEHVVASKQQSTGRKINQQPKTVGDDNSTMMVSTNHMSVDTTTTRSATTTSSIAEIKSAQEVIADFRQECHDKMLNFDLSEDEMTQIPIILRDYILRVTNEDDKLKISMDVLKYIVFEAAEEVNEEWVAHKEPSEFMDDIIITIYKEGAAPDDVLEDMNHAELPEEIRGQQRAIQEQRNKQMTIKSVVQQPVIQFDVEYDDLETLNTKKRDRRTIEDYEREKRSKTK